MSNSFFYKLHTTIAGGAIIISFFSILSRLLGLIRDRLLASTFGAGDTLDVYYAAFRLPDLIFNTLVLGALSAAFIPVFLEYWHKNKEESWEIASSILNILLIVLFILGGLFFIFAPFLISHLVAPGFGLEKQVMTVRLTRIMLISIFFFTASNLAGAILNSFKKFLAYSIAPVMYNLGIIFGIIFLVPLLGEIGLAFGVVLGSFLHLLVQIPSLLKTGFSWKPVFNFKHKGVRKVGLLMLPRTFALAVNQVNRLVITNIASTLTVGSIAVYNLADNLQSFPIGIFAIPLAIACFPYLSESAAKNEKEKFAVHFSVTLRRVIFLIVPTSLFIFFLRAQIVRLVLGAGHFSWRDTILTLKTLGYFSLSLFAQALIPLLARAFYALQDTKTPVFIGFLSVGFNLIFALCFTQTLGTPGLALAFSLASIINFLLLYIFLRKKLKWFDEKKIIFSFFKILIISLIAVFFLQIAKTIMGHLVNMRTFSGVFCQFIVAGLVGLVVYLFLAILLKCEEIEVLRLFLGKKFNFLKR